MQFQLISNRRAEAVFVGIQKQALLKIVAGASVRFQVSDVRANKGIYIDGFWHLFDSEFWFNLSSPKSRDQKRLERRHPEPSGRGVFSAFAYTPLNPLSREDFLVIPSIFSIVNSQLFYGHQGLPIPLKFQQLVPDFLILLQKFSAL